MTNPLHTACIQLSKLKLELDKYEPHQIEWYNINTKMSHLRRTIERYEAIRKQGI